MAETAELNIEEASTSMASEIMGNDAPVDDLDSAVDDAVDKASPTETAAPEKAAAVNGADKSAPVTADAKPAADAPIPMPKSWAKEQQEVWDEMTPRARAQYVHREKQMLDGLEGYKGDAEYGRTLRGVLSKHEDVLKQQGIQAHQAVEFLFNAHRNLSMGTPEQRQAYLERVAQTYGITPKQAAAAVAGDTVAQAAALPPEIKAVIERQERIEAALRHEDNQRFEAVKASTAKEVEAFAADAAHPYFDEVADDIALLIKTGATLKDAYEKAVWANPVTRQKELTRIQQESEAAKTEKAKEAAKAAKRATSTNVKGRDTTRTPTEGRATLDRMDEVLTETLADIKSRH